MAGDGNCLFRALADQEDGDDAGHATVRYQVVDFMRKHSQDFEPFLVDAKDFETHLRNLGTDKLALLYYAVPSECAFSDQPRMGHTAPTTP